MYRKGALLLLLLQITLGVAFFCTTEIMNLEQMMQPVAQMKLDSRILADGKPCFFDDPTDVGNLISGSSAFSKSGFQ